MSGIDTWSIESGTYTSAALCGIYNGKAYKCDIQYHIMYNMSGNDAMFSVIQPGPLSVKCCALKSALHQRHPEMSVLAKNIQSLHSQACRKHWRTITLFHRVCGPG